MRLSARFLVPIIAAVALAGGLLGYAWWQLRDTEYFLRTQIQKTDTGEQAVTATGAVASSVDDTTGDIVLIHLRQGDLLALQGDWSGAEREYQQSADAGGGIAALRRLAQAQMQRREIDKVQGTIKELRRLGARSEDLLLLSLIIDLRTGKIALAEQALAAAADSPQKHYGAALLAIIQAKHDQAKVELKAVQNGWDPTLRSYARTLSAAYDEFALFPESRDIHLTTLLSRALAQVQECELALPLLAQVVSQQDDYRDAWTVQGYCELTTERTNDALASFEKAYAIDPEKPEIQYFLGRTYVVLKQWKNAATFLQYALVNGFEPKKEVRRRLAEAAELAGDLPLALEQNAALLTEPDADIDLFQKTVTLAIGQDKKEDAYQFAQSALKKWPDSAKAEELVGISAAATDRKDEAKAAVEKALKMDPTLVEAKTQLKVLMETK